MILVSCGIVILFFNWIGISHVLPVHPNLYFSSRDINRFREQAQTTHHKIFLRLTLAAEQMKRDPARFLPPRDWNKFASRWNEDHGNNFGALAIYCVLNHTDIQARDVAMRFFDSFVSLPNWRVSASMVDDVPVAHSLVAVATAYDFLYEYLNDTLRTKTLRKISDVTKELYDRSFSISWGKQYIQNHVATNYVALFTGALVVEQHLEKARIWKDRAHRMLERTMFLLSLVIDGSLEEGVAYGSYSSRSLTQYIFLAKRHLGIDLTTNPWLREHFWFMYRTILPGFTETVGIADSNSNWFYGPESQLVFLDNYVMRNGYGNWLAGKIRRLRLESPEMAGSFGHRFCTLHTEFIFYNASIPETQPPYASTPQLHVFEDWGVVTYGGGALSKDGQRITFVSFKTSVLHGRAVNDIVRRKPYKWITGKKNFNPGHEHPDQGSFVFAPGGVPFITEALYGPKYTWLNNALLFGPTTMPTCSGPYEGQIGDCGKWMGYKGDATWFADGYIVTASKADEVVFISGEFSGWYRAVLGLTSVYRAVVLLNPGVLLVVDHVETTQQSPSRHVGAFFHNRNAPFVLQEDQYGDTLASVTLNGEPHLVLWTNSHRGESTVQSQSAEYPAESGTRKTHFLNITTNLNWRQTRLGYLFVAHGNKVTRPKLQGNEIGVHTFVEINGLSYQVSIATNFQKKCQFLGFDGFAKIQVGSNSPLEFGTRNLPPRSYKKHVCRVQFSSISLIVLFASAVGFATLLFLQRTRRRVLKCKPRFGVAYLISGIVLIWILIIGHFHDGVILLQIP